MDRARMRHICETVLETRELERQDKLALLALIAAIVLAYLVVLCVTAAVEKCRSRARSERSES